MYRMTRLGLFLLILCAVLSCSDSHRDTHANAYHITGKTMGTTYNVKLISTASVDKDRLKAAIDTKLVAINQLMSTYIADSELSRFNQSPANIPFVLSPETTLVLSEALRIGELSQARLDVTVGPLVNLWGFGPTKRAEVTPSPAQIEQAKSITGLDKLVLQDNRLTKTVSGVYVDLSTIAKGYGVDAISELLQERAISHYLVEIGGEMRVAGTKLGGEAWRIAIEKPIDDSRSIQRIISIGDNAIATSGDYRNYYEENGVRYSHLIDAATGYPIQHNTVSATVVDVSSMTADGLATALMILSGEQAIALAEANNIAVLLIFKEGAEFVEYQSPAFIQQVSIIK